MKKLTACPVCQKTDMTTYTKCDDHMKSQETFTLTKCTNCGLITTNPRPLEKELGKYYEFEDYISHSETKKGLINKWYHIIKRLNTNKKVNILSKEKGRLLEIGSGAGFLLNKCKERGWDTVGIGANAKARENAKASNNIKLKASIGEIKHEENTFDRVMMWHVLEHVAGLDGLFTTINKVIKKNGKLIIAVPNSNANEIKKVQVALGSIRRAKTLISLSKK
jgi:2-polyprenyl-3-methyl-5-hydroxy-6-metoxy-1,4-benzoquinol methylase